MSTQGTAIIKRAAEQPEDDVRLQQLWIASQSRPWRSLAIIGAGPETSTMDAANALARIAWRYSGEPTAVFDLRDLSLRLVEHQVREIMVQVSLGDRVFIALRSLSENPTALPVARSADAVVLCVTLKRTSSRLAKKTVATVGRERFLGSILIEAAPPVHNGEAAVR